VAWTNDGDDDDDAAATASRASRNPRPSPPLTHSSLFLFSALAMTQISFFLVIATTVDFSPLSVIIITFFFLSYSLYTPSPIIYIYETGYMLPPPTTLRKINILFVSLRACVVNKYLSTTIPASVYIILYYIMCTHTRSTLMHYHKLSSYYYYYYDIVLLTCSLCRWESGPFKSRVIPLPPPCRHRDWNFFKTPTFY